MSRIDRRSLDALHSGAQAMRIHCAYPWRTFEHLGRTIEHLDPVLVHDGPGPLLDRDSRAPVPPSGMKQVVGHVRAFRVDIEPALAFLSTAT